MIPILDHKDHDRPSVFSPDGLLREARRQKSLASGKIPEVCLLDPDGDLFRELRASGARLNPHWACYHTELFELETAAETIGVIGCAVGASFAVLIAEELFASGCRLLVSVPRPDKSSRRAPRRIFCSLIVRCAMKEPATIIFRPSLMLIFQRICLP